MKYSKSWTQALQEVRSHNQETEVPEGLSKEGAAEFMAAASAAKKAGKKKFKFGDKEYPVTIKTDIPTEGVKEQVGVRKVDFVDGITPDLEEAKGEFEVKYASSKKGPIKVSTFNTLEDAKKFLAQVKKEGMNGIISKGGKPVKEDEDLEKVAKELEKASKMHLGQSKRVKKHLDKMKEEIELDEDKKWHYYNLDRGVYKLQKDNNGKIVGKMHDRQKEMKAGFPNADEVLSNTKQAVAKVAKLNEHCGECGATDHVDEGAYLKTSGYELYHKDFSSAMQHSYDIAKKRGFTVDPEEIDNKVATGPRKPSKGKTNRYILGTDKKQNLHVQVTNLDNKRFELNMYIEETEIDEKADKKTKDRLKMFKGLRDKKASQGFQKTDLANVEQKLVGGQKKLDKDKDGDLDAKDFAMLRKSKKKSESKLYSHVKNMMKKEYANVKKMKKMKSEDYLDMWLNDEIELSEDFNQEVIELTQLHDEGKLTDAELEESILKKVGGAVARGAGRAAMGAGKLAGRAAKAGARVAGKAAVAGAKAGGKLAVKGAKAGVKRMSTQGRIDAAKKKADKFKKKSAQRKELKKVSRDAATAQRRYKAGK